MRYDLELEIKALEDKNIPEKIKESLKIRTTEEYEEIMEDLSKPWEDTNKYENTTQNTGQTQDKTNDINWTEINNDLDTFNQRYNNNTTPHNNITEPQDNKRQKNIYLKTTNLKTALHHF